MRRRTRRGVHSGITISVHGALRGLLLLAAGGIGESVERQRRPGIRAKLSSGMRGAGRETSADGARVAKRRSRPAV